MLTGLFPDDVSWWKQQQKSINQFIWSNLFCLNKLTFFKIFNYVLDKDLFSKGFFLLFFIFNNNNNKLKSVFQQDMSSAKD